MWFGRFGRVQKHYFGYFRGMDSELMHADYGIDAEEFFGNERKQLTINKNFVQPLQFGKTVCIHEHQLFIDKIE